MTETEWLECTNPGPMLELLPRVVSARKVRLVACALCRTVWAWLTDRRSQQAIITSERFANGTASGAGLWIAREGAEFARNEMSSTSRLAAEAACGAARHVADTVMLKMVLNNIALLNAAGPQKLPDKSEKHVSRVPEFSQITVARESVMQDLHAARCRLIRDIAGNPFRPSVVDPVWLAWNQGTIPALGRAAVADLVEDRLAILADAGCDDEAMLSHLREPGPHVLGCWALDLILGM